MVMFIPDATLKARRRACRNFSFERFCIFRPTSISDASTPWVCSSNIDRQGSFVELWEKGPAQQRDKGECPRKEHHRNDNDLARSMNDHHQDLLVRPFEVVHYWALFPLSYTSRLWEQQRTKHGRH